MQTHTVDIANGVPDTDVPKFDEGGEYADGNEVEVLLDNLTYDILYNMSADSVFAEDENLRKAIAYALSLIHIFVCSAAAGKYGGRE